MKFTQKFDSIDIDVYGLPEGDYGYEALIKWEADIEVRKYGIKSIVPVILEIDIQVENKDTLETYPLDVSLFEIISEIKVNETGYLSIHYIDIDVTEKTITID